MMAVVSDLACCRVAFEWGHPREGNGTTFVEIL